MTTKEFLLELQNILQLDEPLTPTSDLSDDSWDSMAQMAVLAFFGKAFGHTISMEDIYSVDNVSDLLEIAKPYIKD